jgi:hypothetical protein
MPFASFLVVFDLPAARFSPEPAFYDAAAAEAARTVRFAAALAERA